MPTITYKGGTLQVDEEDGYFVDPGRWDMGVARVLALREGIPELAEDMLDIVIFNGGVLHQVQRLSCLTCGLKKCTRKRSVCMTAFPIPSKPGRLRECRGPRTEVLSLIRHEVAPYGCASVR